MEIDRDASSCICGDSWISIVASASDNPMRAAKRAAIAAAKAPSERDQQAVITKQRASSLHKKNTTDTLRRSLTPADADLSAQLQARARELVEQDYGLLAAPASQDARQAQLISQRNSPDFLARIQAIWIDSKASSRLSDVIANLQLDVTDPAVLTFDAVRLTATDDGVVNSDDSSALVTFTGRFSHRLSGSEAWEDESLVTFTVRLQQADGAWKLADYSAAPTGDGS